MSGYAPDSAVTFFCFAKRKSPKKRRAGFVARLRRYAALLDSSGVGLLGSDTNLAKPQVSAAALCAAPYGRAEGSANLGSDPKNPNICAPDPPDSALLASS